MKVSITITAPQGAGKPLLAEKLRTFLSWLGVTDVTIKTRLP